MPATGKQLATDDEVLARIRRLEQKVEALKNGSLDIELGGTTEEIWVVTSITLDVDGHVTDWLSRKLIIEDGIITGIE